MWFGIILLVFFLLWVFFGGKPKPFKGISEENVPKQVPTPVDLDPPLNVPEEPLIPSLDSDVLYETDIELPEELPSSSPPRPLPRNPRYKRENLCCQVAEEIFGCPFTSQKPKWLTNPETGYRLQLDCYNNDLKLAFEHNGEQHYNGDHYYNRDQNKFISQLKRDEIKKELCRKKGVDLIIIPYTVKEEDIREFISLHLPARLRMTSARSLDFSDE